MRDGRLERHAQAGLHHRQAHRYPGRGEALCKRAEGAKELDGGVGQGSTTGGLLRRAERVSAAEARARDGVLSGSRRAGRSIGGRRIANEGTLSCAEDA